MRPYRCQPGVDHEMLQTRATREAAAQLGMATSRRPRAIPDWRGTRRGATGGTRKCAKGGPLSPTGPRHPRDDHPRKFCAIFAWYGSKPAPAAHGRRSAGPRSGLRFARS